MRQNFLTKIDWRKIHEQWMALDAFTRFENTDMPEKCPWCGRDFGEWTGAVYDVSQECYVDYYDSDVHSKNYHTECWRERKLAKDNQEQPSYTEFDEKLTG